MAQQKSNQEIAREAVGIFQEVDAFEAAINELQQCGFARHELSVLANEEAVERELGHIYKRVEEMEDSPNAPRTVFIPNETIKEAEGAIFSLPLYIAGMSALGVVVASGGTLLTILVATLGASGAGALIGGALASFLGEDHAESIQNQLDHGGLLLWVHTDTPEKEKTAVEILKKHSARDVHIHEIPV